MNIHLPERIAGTKDALFVLEAEFPGAAEQRTVYVETQGPIEALDLRGNQPGGVYMVPIGIQRLHVPMRVKSDGGGTATVTVRCETGPEAGTSSVHEIQLDAPAMAQKGARPGGKLAVAALLLAGLGAAGAFVVPKLLGGPKVPNVVLQTQAQAERSLRQAHYIVELSNEAVEDEGRVGRVVRTIPSPGTALATGKSVELVIGMAEGQRVQVPELVGQVADTALDALDFEDLQGTEHLEDVSDPQQVGAVVRQSPQGGTYVAKGTVVNVFIGRARTDAVADAGTGTTDAGTPGTEDTPETDGSDPIADAPDLPDVPPSDATPGMRNDPTANTVADAATPSGPAPIIPTNNGIDERPVPLPDTATTSRDTPTDLTNVTEAPPAMDDGDLPGPGPERDGSADAGMDDAGDDEPELVVIPAVKGLATADAEKQFDEIGLFAIVDYEEVQNPGWDGKVVRQSPEPGSKVAKNTQVFLVVGRKAADPVPPKDEPTQPIPPKDEPTPPVQPKDEPTPPVQPKDEPTQPVAPKDEPTIPGPKDAPIDDVPVRPTVEQGVVPDLVAQPRGVAEGLVREAGFHYQIELEVTGDVPDGQVISQDPASGQSLAQGGEIKLIVSRAPIESGVEVPNVIGRTRNEATRILRNESFLVRVSYGGGEPTKLGRVTDQAPPAGTRRPRRSWVEIVVVSGTGPARAARGGPPEGLEGETESTPPTDSGELRRPVAVPDGPSTRPAPTPRRAEPPPPVRLPSRDAPADLTVPDVANQAARDAIQAILKAGLVPIVETAREGGKPAGTVVAQNPKPGTKARGADLVRIQVVLPSSPQSNVFIPNALGSTVEKMRQRLAVSGVRLEIVEVEVPGHPYAKTQRVAGQFPAGTTARDYATTVTVWVIK